ncbi:FAD-binding and (Fe-S)-binding domain-containing protein [Salinarimonas ramus]|uniref:Dimethylmenaquinone methyltransferase n=1 Tax=Salinarimonas ramus TaxID=690164 RepID=A0A917QF62_9HYPH|nr:FAD-binding and (Fe-S)-binding domain-containing protein [Salinarimonas ramus]GGK48481.1 dimethylmenaquinone methyltransferase [Salinarimonas ramus]
MDEPARVIHRNAAGRIETEAARFDGDARALERDLAERVNGEVRFSDGDRALYATDASNYRQVPIGVVVPRTVEAGAEAMRTAIRHHAPILSRGGGTSLAGQCTNTAVVIDWSKHCNRVLGIDAERRTARVEPGCILDVLRAQAERHHLTFGPDPATHDHNTLGGMIGNNSCGVHSVIGKRTADNVEALDILTPRGLRLTVGKTSDEDLARIRAEGGPVADLYDNLDAFRKTHARLLREGYPDLPRRVSGFADLDKLLPEHGFDVAKALVGTEGTCVAILGATLTLIESPPERVLCVLSFPSIFEAADEVVAVREHGPIAIEGIDGFLVDAMHRKHLHEEDMKVLPEGHSWLAVEFGAFDRAEAEEKARALCAAYQRKGVAARVLTRPTREQKLWSVREAGLPGSAYIPDRPETWEGWEDTAVPPAKLGAYLRDLKALYDRYGYVSPMYGHFGDGLVHCRVSFDLKHEDGVAQWGRFLGEAADLVVRHGGSLSGEHGDGQARGELLERMYGSEMLAMFRAFKGIFDPDGLMNPGKILDAYPATSNLRLGPAYDPDEPKTVFSFHEEGGFVAAAERCVGVGKCRRIESSGGVMCPSFMATREEKHSTRGRSRLLFEMLHGGAMQGGFHADAVEDALSLCLACKGCKSDCPVNVDMATYKAEFRAHYYKRKLRPRAAYSMGLIHLWARIGSKLPRLANFAAGFPGISRLAKSVGGIAQERDIPKFATRTFRAWFEAREDRPTDGERVLIWPDTFNDNFRPDTLIAATLILERAGYAVDIPPRPLCCGRALYDEGFLGTAQNLWFRTLTTLKDDIAARTPIIGLEPACTTAFKDELVNLFPDDQRARDLSAQTSYFSDFVMADEDRFDLPRIGEGALVQIHCHHHAVIKDAGERALMDKLGIEAEIAPSGCCGMAGSFGFARETYPVSRDCGERVILPMVREAEPGRTILADGFSCREQIEQGAGRPTRHLAELMAERMGLSTHG